MNKIAVYIDNSNVFRSIHRIRNDIKDFSWIALYDPLKLGQILAGNRELQKVNFYCVPPPPWLLADGPDKKVKHALAMKYYATVAKLPNVEVKYGYMQGDMTNAIEKNVDTQLATDMVADAALNMYDTAILISSDGDYMSAVQNVKRLGKRIELVFFPGCISGALKQVCDVKRRARKSYFQPIQFN
jgi:uncharacterized LabA/DUF88 family protein